MRNVAPDKTLKLLIIGTRKHITKHAEEGMTTTRFLKKISGELRRGESCASEIYVKHKLFWLISN